MKMRDDASDPSHGGLHAFRATSQQTLAHVSTAQFVWTPLSKLPRTRLSFR